MEPTYRVKIFKNFTEAGFSLFEVLAVIVLIGILSTMGYRMISGQTGKDKLDEFKDDLSRTISFASSEAIIRNRVIRLIIHMDKTPQSYSLEMASTTQLLLPEKSDGSEFKREEDDEETKAAKIKFNQNFLPHPEGEAKDFSIDVLIVGVGHLENKDLQLAGDFSTFFYPSGEKDPAVIIVATKDEVMGLSYDTFRDRMQTKYFPIETQDLKDFAEKIFKDWKP